MGKLSFSVSDELEAFIAERVKSGDFADPSDYMATSSVMIRRSGKRSRSFVR